MMPASFGQAARLGALWPCVVFAMLGHADDSGQPLPRIPWRPAEQAVAAMQVAEGFEVQLVAAEPNIGTPVEICWDAKGRMFVCEMKGYSEHRDEGLSRISRLEDRDADGFYETSTVFAEGLLWPTAIFPYRDGLFVADAPDILFLSDADGDGRADDREVVLTGFGTDNVQGLLNSFRFGLDNRIHVACSSNGGLISRPGRRDRAIDVRGRDLAFDPDTFAWELTSGGGQHGMSFDDWGRKYVSSNSDHIQQIMFQPQAVADQPFLTTPPARVSIAADGPQAEVFRVSPVEPWRIMRTRLRVSGLVGGPVEGGGRAAGYFTGATGVTIYRGDAWPARHRGGAFIGDVGSNLIHRKRIDTDELQHVARRIDDAAEFIASTDNWFRPAQFACGPDGNLYVVDVCREVIEHPRSLPPEIKQQVDLDSGRDAGRIFRVVASDAKPRHRVDLESRSGAELVALLGHANAWHRETAARLLFQRQDTDVVDTLRSLARRSSSPLARLHALYVLSGMKCLDSMTLGGALADDHPQLRRHAIDLSERDERTETLITALPELCNDRSIEVRFRAALAMAHLAIDQKANLLATIIRRDVADPWMRLAVLSGSLDVEADLFRSLATDDRFVSPDAGRFMRSLASHLRRRNEPASLAGVIATIADLPEPAPTFWLPVVGELLSDRQTGSSAFRRQGLQVPLAGLDRVVGVMEDRLLTRAADKSASSETRIEAVETLASSQGDRIADVLGRLLTASGPPRLHGAVVGVLTGNPSRRTTEIVLTAWPQLAPSVRREAVSRWWGRAEGQRRLVQAMEAGRLAETEISRSQWQAAARSRDPIVSGKAKEYLDAHRIESRGQVIADYQVALTSEGDPVSGREVFKKNCSSCHRVGGQGIEVGPNLAAFASRGGAPVLVNVLDPNREVNPQYFRYTVLTNNGQVISGMIVGESEQTVTLVGDDGKSTTLLREEIEELQSTGKSLMPEGLEDAIDPSGMADLIAYLSQVAVEPTR